MTTTPARRHAGIPLVRAAVVRPVVGFLHRIGARVDALLDRAGLRPDDVEDDETQVPLVFANRLLHLAARNLGAPNLGLLCARDVDPLTLGTYGRLVSEADTLGEALERSRRLKPAWNSGARVWFVPTGNEIELRHRFIGGDDTWAQSVDVALLLHLNLLQRATGGRWRLRRLALPVPAAPWYRDVPMLADVDIRFGGRSTAIAFPASLLALPMPWRHREPRAGGAGVGLEPPPQDLVLAVRAFVRARLWSGYPTMAFVAEAAAMHPRTFQRRLAERGVTYAQIVNHVRLTEASRRLVESQDRISDIAYDLGYSDPAHFTRAFLAWTGSSPRAFRLAHGGDGAANARDQRSAS